MSLGIFQPEIMEGARNLISYTNLKEGEKVLILTDLSEFAHPLAVEAMGLACKEKGGDVVFASCRWFEPRVEEPSKIIQNAFYASDVLLDFGEREATFHSVTGRTAWFEYGLRIYNVVAHTPELLASEWARFPMPIHFEILRKVDSQVRGKKIIKVTSPNGTEISAGLSDSHIVGGSRDERGLPHPKGFTMSMLPRGVLGVTPMPPSNGVIVYDALIGFKGLLEEPVTLTVEDSWVTKVEGGPEAQWFRKLLERKKREGIETSNYFTEIMWGLNPKASIKRGLESISFREAELTRRAGTLHCGIGVLGHKFHWDGVLVKPFSLFADGETIIDKGRLTALDDPEVRAIAKEFGDPDDLLSEVL